MMKKLWQLGSQRRNLAHIPTLTFFVLLKFVLVNGSCPTNWTEWNLQFCYHVYGDPKPWDTAKTYCENLGGHLASIHSDEEMSFLSTLIKLSGKESENVWIGLNDISKELDFHWSDKSPFDYSYWRVTPSNQTQENCVFILSESAGQFEWYVGACGIWWPSICKRTSTIDEDNRRQIYSSLKNKMLFNHVLRAQNASSLLYCSSLCLNENNCKSFSYGNSACYLNNATDKDFPDDLVEKDSFVYAVPIK